MPDVLQISAVIYLNIDAQTISSVVTLKKRKMLCL